MLFFSGDLGYRLFAPCGSTFERPVSLAMWAGKGEWVHDWVKGWESKAGSGLLHFTHIPVGRLNNMNNSTTCWEVGSFWMPRTEVSLSTQHCFCYKGYWHRYRRIVLIEQLRDKRGVYSVGNVKGTLWFKGYLALKHSWGQIWKDLEWQAFP